jgi:NarL family two-component system sensor histidine kinase LiaS
VSGEPFADPYAPGEARQIIARALLGEPASARLQDRSILAAQPVLDDGKVVGVVYLRIASFSLLAPNLLGGALGIIGGSALLLTLGAGFVGTVFGFLTARGLVRRLETLAYSTEAWGRGDFTATVDDTSADEIGQLSRRLDLMAGEIQDLLQARQELATLEERNRLARDLHDSVKQQVFATTMNLGAAETLWERDPEAARQKVAQALAISRTAQQELTGLIHELRPVTLEGKELVAALREHLAWWSRQTGIIAGVSVQGEGTLPQDLEQAYFRVAQEALANVAKHSEASRVEVTLSHSGDNVILEVRDDGQGFVLPAARGQGMGLRSMRERVEALGGDLRVDSAPGEGTRVTARCGLTVPGGGDSA